MYVKMFKIFFKKAQRIIHYTLLDLITQNQQILRFGQFVSNKEIKHWRESRCPYFSLESNFCTPFYTGHSCNESGVYIFSP